MPNSALTLRMVIAKPGEVDLASLVGARPESAPIPHERKPFRDLAASLGFGVLGPRLQGVKLLESGRVGARADYYGDFTPGAASTWEYRSRSKVVHLEQRRILRSFGPKYFVYGPEIEAYQTEVAEGLATIVLPRGGDTLCFAIWAKEDSVADVTFSWPVKGPVVEEFLASLG